MQGTINNTQNQLFKQAARLLTGLTDSDFTSSLNLLIWSKNLMNISEFCSVISYSSFSVEVNWSTKESGEISLEVRPR